ncbi:MAG: uroporphyrinogen-III C-methyltransferase [Pirellulales bacterium]|nr:uroporphyrinogen-III C-methyltransferase [Pirellulales bacterium]
MPLPSKTTGKVYFVGAGPGDPGLITLRGVECLRMADLVLHDYLVNRELLDHAPPSAEKVCLGHHHTGREYSQEEVNAQMIAAARAGKSVVRLKGGDPLVFGRAAEETAALAAAGIAYEIVPGVTAAIAAAGYAEIPITSGQQASAVAFITGHERSAKAGERLDYAALADFPGTLVFYMGIRSADRWSQALLARGKPPQTPAAIVRRCSWPDQEVVRCTLGDIAEVVETRGIRPPAVIVVGEVVEAMPAASWFAAQPLFGKSVLITRPRESRLGDWSIFRREDTADNFDFPRIMDLSPSPRDEMTENLRAWGAEVLFQSAIAISAPLDWGPLDRALARLEEFDWLVFSSMNGVRYFLERLLHGGGDARRLGKAKIAAIGPSTAEELKNCRLRADLVPGEFRAEALADALCAEAAGRRFLLIRASRGREVLAEQLAAAGATVEQVVAYSSIDVERPDEAVAARLAAGGIDWITVSSSSIARSLAKLFGENLRRTKLASISPVTSATLRELGFEPAVEARQFTAIGLAEAILERENEIASIPSR